MKQPWPENTCTTRNAQRLAPIWTALWCLQAYCAREPEAASGVQYLSPRATVRDTARYACASHVRDVTHGVGEPPVVEFQGAGQVRVGASVGAVPFGGQGCSGALPAPPRRGGCPRRPGARRRVRVLSRPGRPRAVEPRHDDAPVPLGRPSGRHRQLPKRAAPLFGAPAPGRGHRPEHRGRAPRACGGLHHLEVLRPVHQARRPARRRGDSLPTRRAPKKERLRELYDQHQTASGVGSLAALAVVIGPQAGLDEDIALAWLIEFAAVG
jgi:hypothetical protein